ncbi:hypothetical protein K1719_029319 [Acacia pycnantha]|nr:hypothetical protein K1719_029319 [Acacia pycnantha]
METLKNEIRVSVIPRAAVKPSDSNPSSSHPQDRLVRVYADGVYDLFHFGHARSIEQAKISYVSIFIFLDFNFCKLGFESKRLGERKGRKRG